MSDIYTPTGAIPLNTAEYNFQLRLGIQGAPGTSKTWASTTFKNPIFLSFDRGLISHIGRPDIIELPFYSAAYVNKINKYNGSLPPDRKEALVTFLNGEAQKLTQDQTLILDASTGIQAAYHRWWEQNKLSFATKSGEVDARKEWRLKLDYFSEIMQCVKALRCNVIYICHEAPDRNDKGDLNGQVRPLLTGQFQDELQSHFTDWFRANAFAKPAPDKMEDFKKFFSLTDADAKEWLATGTKETIYVWQTQSDSVCKCKTSMFGAPKFVLANSSVFDKYKRKVS